MGVYDRRTSKRSNDVSHGGMEKTVNSKEPEELESKFYHFDVANLYPNSPFNGRNIVGLDFVYERSLDRYKSATPHYP